ncbi:MAG TPA: hypothetical protein VL899_05935 [Alphaproteobacteria bacterium]|nr:hypothetical protein [Alphaproteobacteria bacterium]
MFAAKHEPKAAIGVSFVMNGAGGIHPLTKYSETTLSCSKDASFG